VTDLDCAHHPIIPHSYLAGLTPRLTCETPLQRPHEMLRARGREMGVGMQIVYLGFAGTSQIEGEAAARLVRLERFSKSISDCHLALEFIRSGPGVCGADALRTDRRSPAYDARIDLIMRNGDLVPVRHCQGTDAEAAIQAAFDSAELQLEGSSALT
jgi:hypothetical protein